MLFGSFVLFIHSFSYFLHVGYCRDTKKTQNQNPDVFPSANIIYSLVRNIIYVQLTVNTMYKVTWAVTEIHKVGIHSRDRFSIILV